MTARQGGKGPGFCDSEGCVCTFLNFFFFFLFAHNKYRVDSAMALAIWDFVDIVVVSHCKFATTLTINVQKRSLHPAVKAINSTLMATPGNFNCICVLVLNKIVF